MSRIEEHVPALWYALWRLMRRYHRFEVEGFHHLEEPGAAVVVGYHGRGGALDLCMLSTDIIDRLGYMPHGIVHRLDFEVPVIREACQALNFVAGDSPALDAAAERGEHIITTPGGSREGARGFLDPRYEVDWGQRLGYLRMALRLGLPVIPTAADGVDGFYLGLNNGYRLGKRLGVPGDFPVWFAYGIIGQFPLAVPFPVKVRLLIGERMRLDADGPVDLQDRDALLALHDRVRSRVQALLHEARGRRRGARRDARTREVSG